MFRRKLSLDSLAVDSFATAEAAPEVPGTVEGQAAPCTSPATCKCPTSLFRCGTIASTAYSCPVTFDC
jgi:hypothetical protein